MRPIKSISSTVAIRGSSINILFLMNAMGYSGCVGAAVLLNWLDLHKHSALTAEEMDINHAEQALAICSVLSMPLVGFFELDVKNRLLMVLHYVGVLFKLMMVWPFAIQSGYSVFSVVIIVVTYLSLAFWWWIGSYYPNDVSKGCANGMAEEEMKRKVHWMSVHCLSAQIVGSIGCLGSMSLYIWHIQEVGCVNGDM